MSSLVSAPAVASTRVPSGRGLIPIQIVRMSVLLVPLIDERQEHKCRFHKFSWTLMRHFVAVALLPRGMITRALTAALVAAPRLSQRPRSHRFAARPSAIAVSPVAPATEKEHLPALRPATDDESQRVHGPGAGQKLDVRPDSCDLFSRRHRRSWRNDPSARRWRLRALISFQRTAPYRAPSPGANFHPRPPARSDFCVFR